ncbi:hypothetical protein B0T17DRAFT_476568, partial [Bombardia bombarda]
APPSTVRPSQVSLPHSLHDTADLLHMANPVHAGAPLLDAPPLESFARIEFADSVFQMTTYAVIIGRDQRALEQARRDERRNEEYKRRKESNEAQGLPPPTIPNQDRKFSKSYVSEEGGMLGPESDGDENPRPSKRRKISPGGSLSGNSQQQQQQQEAVEFAGQDDRNLIVNRQYVSHTPGAAAVNLTALRPSPYHVPFIGIHSPGPQIALRTKAISREHLKIQFNREKGVFEAIPLHKNGFFCEDVHYKDEKVILKSGDHLQIKDVDFQFLINGVELGKSGAEEYFDEDDTSVRRYSEGGKEMSFEFESSRDAEKRSTSVEDVEMEVDVPEEESQSELSEAAEEDGDLEDEDTSRPETGSEPLHDLLGALPPKKRGPGRPPKNGIMSKREERLRKKAAMELAKKNMPPPPPGEPPIKRKVGRPRKHPLPEDASDRPEKRKYKPRKSKNGEEGGEGSDAEKAVREKRREKPKTPPLELKREDYTEEQLQKPNKNYGVLIDEVLTAAPDGLTLKQIYKRIQMKYPFYYFTVDTKGWESSVRHNLIGNDAFKKNEETHLWSRVPGIDIDAGKKRKATSPDQTTSLQGFGQHYPTPMAPHPTLFHGEHASQQGYHPGPVPQRSHSYISHGQSSIGQQAPPQHLMTSPPAVGTAAQQGAPRPNYATPTPQAAPAHAHAHAAGYVTPAAARPLPAGTQATPYSSPYASKPPPPSSTAHPGATPHSMARQLSQPPNAPRLANGLPRVDPLSAHTGAPRTVGAVPQQAAIPNSSPVFFKPAVAPELVKRVTDFRRLVITELEKRTPTMAEAVAMSAINRGLRLAEDSMIPEGNHLEKTLEKTILQVFEANQKNQPANSSLHPALIQTLVKFKTEMINTLQPALGSGPVAKQKAERLVLSAMDRVLGFVDHSTV